MRSVVVGGSCSCWLLGGGGFELFDLDVLEPDGLAFGLEGDVAELQGEGRSGGEEFLGVDDGAFGVELGLLVAEDFLSVDAVDDFLVTVDFHFDFDPLVGGDVPGRGFNDVLGDELAVDFKIGAGGANVAGGALALAFVREELEFDADRESLFEGHTLRGLGVDHDAAVEVHVGGGIGHHFAGEFVFEAKEVVGV